MKTEDVLQSKVIDFLRFPMIVGVVFLHAFLESIQGVNVPKEGLPFYHHLSFFISRGIVLVAVPLFFFISGYLFFYRTSFSLATYKQKLQSRVKTLLVPYLFWNLFILACHWMVSWLSPIKLTSGAYKLVSDYTLIDYLNIFWSVNSGQPIDGVLWFIRDLMIMVVCAPLVYVLLRYLRWYVLLVAGGLWFMGYSAEIPKMSAIFFFMLGAWFSMGKRNFVNDFKSFFPWGMGLYVVIVAISVVYRDSSGLSYILHAGVLLGIVAFVSLTTYFVGKGAWKASTFLTSSCFMVYAFHQLPVNAVVRVYTKFMPLESDWQYVLVYILAPTLIIGVDLLAYAFLMKVTPRFAALITGGRS